MKYKYTGQNKICVSSIGNIKRVEQGDIVEFDETDIKHQDLNNFVKIKDAKKVNKEDS